GVLFLDELPEFQKKTLEILRQPMEEHRVTVSRVHGRYEFPAHFMLVAAMNPCPCGFYPDRDRCSCTREQVNKYLGRISGPLLDRIDICAEAAPISFQEMRGAGLKEASRDIRMRVERARSIQRERFLDSAILFNGDMGSREIRRYCRLNPEDEQFLQTVFQKMKLSARGCNKVLKVARTIADLAGAHQIERAHLSEAVGYRDLAEKYWGKGD
ncbi:MAG: ATP-binding protein, partial [Lachnospiraceae bacterium]|nr:ATP-binding protein [Lachnospiraceae bacterium]